MARINVYTDGVWDLFHVSHIEFLKSIKAHVSETQSVPLANVHLVVGVISDVDVTSYKRIPVLNEDQRRRMVACKHVDTVVPNSPLIVTDEILDTHDISFVYHGDDSKQEKFFQMPSNEVSCGIYLTTPNYRLRKSSPWFRTEKTSKWCCVWMHSHHWNKKIFAFFF